MLAAILAISACRLLTVNDVTTGQTPEWPEIRPLVVPVPVPRAFRRSVRVSRQMDGWRDCRRTERFRLHCEAHTLLGFTDDVEVWVEPYGLRGARVMVHSASRVGVGDLGANARRIRAYLEAWQER